MIFRKKTTSFGCITFYMRPCFKYVIFSAIFLAFLPLSIFAQRKPTLGTEYKVQLHFQEAVDSCLMPIWRLRIGILGRRPG